MKIILCGYGSVGQNILKRLAASGNRIIVVDEDESRLSKTSAHTVHGDPTDENTLIGAGIMDAEKLIAATDDDVTNAFIILESKSLNADIEVMSVVNRRENIGKLYSAGADYVVPETVIGARYITKYALHPHIAEFLDKITVAQDIEITKINIPKNSQLVGRRLAHSKIRERTGARVIGIKREEEFIPNPASSVNIKDGDKFIVIGKSEQIHELNRWIRL
ncbi:MAG: TrkA family potassium uptake protein [Candidatus Saliniplasma sp.]